MRFVFLQLFFGIAQGMLLFTVAAGMTLTFGAMRIVNFAHGTFYMLGAYSAVVLTAAFGGEIGFWVALVVAPLLVAVINGLLEPTIMRRIYHRPELVQILTMFGLLLVLGELVRLVFGTRPRALARPNVLSGSVSVGGFAVPVYQLAVVLAGIAIVIFLFWLLARTSVGRSIRAAVGDSEMLSAVGVNVRAVYSGIFVLGGALAGFAGVVAAGGASVYPTMDIEATLQAFAVAAIGGLGSVAGALTISLIVGVVQVFSVQIVPRGGEAILYLIMFAVLAVRPRGLFGAKG